MSEDFIDPTVTGIPVKRGRRDPALAAALGMNDEHEGAEEDFPDDDEWDLANPGDVVGAKATIEVPFGPARGWFQYEMRTRVMPGESEAEANDRVDTVVVERVLKLTDHTINEVTARMEQANNQNIQPRQLRK